MAIPAENVEILLGGLDQKTSSVTTAPGRLETADNIEVDKAGELNKRTGYEAMSETPADGGPFPTTLHRVLVSDDELVVISGSRAFALADRPEGLQTGSRAFVERGIAIVGGVSFVDVFTSSDMEED